MESQIHHDPVTYSNNYNKSGLMSAVYSKQKQCYCLQLLAVLAVLSQMFVVARVIFYAWRLTLNIYEFYCDCYKKIIRESAEVFSWLVTSDRDAFLRLAVQHLPHTEFDYFT